jgi:hypothetical protein
MWINLRLIATTKKNAKAIALSILIPFTINPTIVKHELAMKQTAHCVGSIIQKKDELSFYK